MRYLLRTLIGFALISSAWIVLGYSLYQLLQIGTCASGGPYQVARECPAGTERLGLMIPAALLLIGIGAVVYAGRGRAPGSDRPPRNDLLVIWGWTGIFWSIAAGCFLGVWGSEANPGPGAKEGGLIVGFLFVPMGAGGFLALGARRTVAGVPGALSRVPGSQRVARTAAVRMPGLDPVARLERLAALRDQGAISETEFQKLKAQVLGE